jgi:hypothetical protein
LFVLLLLASPAATVFFRAARLPRVSPSSIRLVLWLFRCADDRRRRWDGRGRRRSSTFFVAAPFLRRLLPPRASNVDPLSNRW